MDIFEVTYQEGQPKKWLGKANPVSLLNLPQELQ
jgi:hypothetical protein